MRRIVPAFLAGCAAAFLPIASARAAETPPGFVEKVVCDGLVQPTSIAFVRPSLFLVATKSGDVFAVKNGRVRPAPVLSLEPSTGLERGLNGIALEPGFRTSGYLYVDYTVRHDPPFNRLSRFHLARAGIGPEEILVEGMPSHSGVHNGGCIRFAPDGSLFFTAGDGGSIFATNPQDLSNLAGKILRVNPDGSIPPDNPFAGQLGVREEIWAYGFRNPWRLAIDPATGRVLANDVGSNRYEEVNAVLAGRNHGWPQSEGPVGWGSSVVPIHSYPHDGADSAVTGAAFCRGGAYPAEYEGAYFFSDFNRGWIDRLTFDAAGEVASLERFATGIPLPVDLAMSPAGELHCVSFEPGRVVRYRYTGTGDRPPVPSAVVEPDTGRAPLDVILDLSASVDPDGDAIDFDVDFGDGTTLSTRSLVLAHRYETAGVFTVRVTASDGRGGVGFASVAVDTTHEPPRPFITLPTANSTYAAGNTILFSGFAYDPDDGSLPDSALSWDMIFHHADHTHPFLGPIAGVRSGSFVVPTGGETSTNVYYEVRLTARDSRGARRSTSVYVWPRLTVFFLLSEPSGMTLNVDGQNAVTPFEVLSVLGFGHDLDAPSPQAGPGGGPLRFSSWNDSPQRARRVYAGEMPVSYTAIFVP